MINYYFFLSVGYSLPGKDTEPGSRVDSWNKALFIPVLTPKPPRILVALRKEPISLADHLGPQNHLGCPLCERSHRDTGDSAGGGACLVFPARSGAGSAKSRGTTQNQRKGCGMKKQKFPAEVRHYSPFRGHRSQPETSLHLP